MRYHCVRIDQSTFRPASVRLKRHARSLVKALIFAQMKAAVPKKRLNFLDIVDLDDEAFEDHVSEMASRLNESNFIKMLMTLIIVVRTKIIICNLLSPR